MTTHPSPVILSFHPMVVGSRNLLCAGRDPGEEERAAMREAGAIILPQACRRSLYQMARESCPLVFPDYDARFRYPGKTGQQDLFEKCGVPTPLTRVFDNLDHFHAACPQRPPLPFPFVLKLDWGGEGDTVFFIENPDSLDQALTKARQQERAGLHGFVLQEFVPTDGRALRVVVVHDQVISYWKTGMDPSQPIVNLAKSATLDPDFQPELQKAGRDAVERFCRQASINLAGLDLIFDLDQPDFSPMFLEINWFFGRRGLGGSGAFYEILVNAVKRWVADMVPGA